MLTNKTENKNLKDKTIDLAIPIKDSFPSVSYAKTNKLIAALYMVTDIVDEKEPIRNKLRHLGAEIISDIHNLPAEACKRIAEIVSFLNIASAVSLVSEMNCNILKKEFLELNQSVKECTQTKPTWIEEFLFSHPSEEIDSQLTYLIKKNIGQKSIGHTKLNGQQSRTRIGIQKGSTLMKALSRIKMSDKNNLLSDNDSSHNYFDILRKQRREKIINIIKDNGGNATIKDIKTKINDGVENSLAYSEKTLQRDLVSMIKNGVLNKTGEKRWSRYFLKN